MVFQKGLKMTDFWINQKGPPYESTFFFTFLDSKHLIFDPNDENLSKMFIVSEEVGFKAGLSFGPSHSAQCFFGKILNVIQLSISIYFSFKKCPFLFFFAIFFL